MFTPDALHMILTAVIGLAVGWIAGRCYQFWLDGSRPPVRKGEAIDPFTPRQHIDFPDRTYLKDRLKVVRGAK